MNKKSPYHHQTHRAILRYCFWTIETSNSGSWVENPNWFWGCTGIPSCLAKILARLLLCSLSVLLASWPILAHYLSLFLTSKFLPVHWFFFLITLVFRMPPWSHFCYYIHHFEWIQFGLLVYGFRFLRTNPIQFYGCNFRISAYSRLADTCLCLLIPISLESG